MSIAKDNIWKPLINDFVKFVIQLPDVVVVDELPVFNVVVTIVLVVGVVAVISVIQLDIELTYYLLNKFQICTFEAIIGRCFTCVQCCSINCSYR